MSLLGLLDEAPNLTVLDFELFSQVPTQALEPEKPLTAEESEHWETIVQGLGDLSVGDDVGTPIWDTLADEYSTLSLSSLPGYDEPWGTPEWIAADFEELWTQATPIWEQTLTYVYLDPHGQPPQGFRALRREYLDLSMQDEQLLERVLSGLRRL